MRRKELPEIASRSAYRAQFNLDLILMKKCSARYRLAFEPVSSLTSLRAAALTLPGKPPFAWVGLF
jgi:hypothetical protein